MLGPRQVSRRHGGRSAWPAAPETGQSSLKDAPCGSVHLGNSLSHEDRKGCGFFASAHSLALYYSSARIPCHKRFLFRRVADPPTLRLIFPANPFRDCRLGNQSVGKPSKLRFSGKKAHVPLGDGSTCLVGDGHDLAVCKNRSIRTLPAPVAATIQDQRYSGSYLKPVRGCVASVSPGNANRSCLRRTAICTNSTILTTPARL